MRKQGSSRRGRHEGTISQRTDGRYMGRVDLGRGPQGKRMRPAVYGRTREECAGKMNALLGRQAAGEPIATRTAQLAPWLDLWFETFKHTWSLGTRRIYRQCIELRLVPALGKYRLTQLTAPVIQAFVNARVSADSPANRVVMLQTLNVLSGALGWAQGQMLLTYNAAALVTCPRPVKKKVVPFTLDEATAILEAAKVHPLGALIILALACGLRVGEACGIRWDDLDLDNRAVWIRQQVIAHGGKQLAELKTEGSERLLEIPYVALAPLRDQRRRQLEQKLRAGGRWKGNPHGMTFTSNVGHLLAPDAARIAFTEVLAAADLAHRNFHQLRHSAATFMLAGKRDNLISTSKVLGHARLSTTADTYGHLIPEMAHGAASRVNAVFGNKRTAKRRA